MGSALPESVPPGGPTPGQPPSNDVTTVWSGDLRFDARHGDATVRVDCRGERGPEPLDAVLQALSACAASDVVAILDKQRTPVRALRVHATADRVATIPRRLSRVHLAFTVSGKHLNQAKVERAVALSVTKYCSVRESLHPAIDVSWTAAIGD